MNPDLSAPSQRNLWTHGGDADLVADTVQWLERAVIGLNLCPFAKAVHSKGQVHYAVCHATEDTGILHALEDELQSLRAADPTQRDTTLLLIPDALQHFLDFNDFLHEGETLLERLGLVGVLQIASFHPDFQFAGTRAEDPGNCTNRSPYPTLHLLREDSIDRAVEAFPEAQDIFERNIAVLDELGMAGWKLLYVGARSSADATESVTK